jgi:alginate O-acetyltransferase complex protein AlgI
VAGPIVRGSEMLPQLSALSRPDVVDATRALRLISRGLIKKVVVANYLAQTICDPVFGSPGSYRSWDLVGAAIAFSVQLYADFSGYTDIAIGVAKLLGFRFPKNFDRPYAAASIQDFWRRWHMTLSRWLRDYLYIPLGGNRRGRGRTYVNVMATMILGGLWHGAAWTFVLWGAYHGGLLAFHQWRVNSRGPDAPEETWLVFARRRVSTFALVCVGWVLFRADSVATAVTMLSRLLTGWFTPTEFVTPVLVFTIAGMLALQFWPRALGLWLQSGLSRLRPAALGVVLGVALLVIVILGPPGVAPFIYFQF